MFFFIPYGTDAPIYHWPIITVFMIAVNCVVFGLQLAYPEQARPFILTFGNGLHPAQWITSNFMHVGIMHLAGNMFALWAFSLIIEGKLGWLKTLVLYLGIGIIGSAIVQYMMLGSLRGGGGLGASGIIYGLMAMSLIWAPVNKIQCFLVVVLFVFIRTANFEISIMAMVGLMLLLQITIQFFIGMQISSAVMHLLGASVGFAVAIALLKARLVDCENWDLFSVLAGRNTMTEEEREQAEHKNQASQQEPEEKIDQQSLREAALKEIHEIIQNAQPQLALKFHQRMSRELRDWILPQNDLFNLILALHKNKLWSESVPLMKEHLKRYPQKSALMQLKLAQILVTIENRPVQALKLLAEINQSELDARQSEILQKLRAKAEQLRDQVPYEISDQEQ
ncbi:MAG: rhomboid family intramembrane serine protease [Thermoguttaceae bacterium]|jgi:membrane associated rhomboid family serine protease